ncbi:MAG: signal peptidase I [Clostridia bacterium]|nr:signal peptidase I [Clostridia bacterium]
MNEARNHSDEEPLETAAQEESAVAEPVPAGEAAENALAEAEGASSEEKEEAPTVPDDTPSSEESPEAVEHPEKKEELSGAANLFDWIKSFLFSLTAVVFIFTLLFRGVTVSGGSMLPTLSNSEYLIISDLMYQPKTGDIVVVQSPHYKNGTEPLIKRVIATGGQTLRINFQTWQIWVDGVELDEDYVFYEPGTYMQSEDMIYDEDGIAEIVVEENCIFVMGDHRNDSLDSRSEAVGQIDERFIMGRVLLRITPFEKFGKVE